MTTVNQLAGVVVIGVQGVRSPRGGGLQFKALLSLNWQIGVLKVGEGGDAGGGSLPCCAIFRYLRPANGP